MATTLKNLSDYDPSSVPSGAGMKIGIVVSEWNEQVTASMAESARVTLIGHGVNSNDIYIHSVPGSFELPLGGQYLFETLAPDAVILIGCVIQGETRHFEFICQTVARGCMDLGLAFNKPCIFGVLTTDTLQQAIDRSGGKHGNKGIEAALAALRMADLKRRLG